LIREAHDFAPEVLFPPVLQARPVVADRILQSLRTAADWPDLKAKLARAADLAALAAPADVPSAAPCDPRLIPLRTVEALKTEGAAMRHCIASFAPQVAAGSVAAFAWSGSERATVTLRRPAPSAPWTFAQALGPWNRALSPPPRRGPGRRRALDRGGAHSWNVSIAGLPHHQADQLRRVLVPGDRLDMEREPLNPHDAGAVAVRCDGLKLGYIPRAANAALARRLDEGGAARLTVTAPWFGGAGPLLARVGAD
jgi:hypothetical protein